MTDRVEIPVWKDHWMKGDRYGEIVKIKRSYESVVERMGEEWADNMKAVV